MKTFFKTCNDDNPGQGIGMCQSILPLLLHGQNTDFEKKSSSVIISVADFYHIILIAF